jgi:hypothetical protein
MQDTGDLWKAALIGCVWQWNHKLWTERNEETHKADGNRGSARDKLEAESRTRALYEQAAHLIVLEDGIQLHRKLGSTASMIWILITIPTRLGGSALNQVTVCV